MTRRESMAVLVQAFATAMLPSALAARATCIARGVALSTNQQLDFFPEHAFQFAEYRFKRTRHGESASFGKNHCCGTLLTCVRDCAHNDGAGITVSCEIRLIRAAVDDHLIGETKRSEGVIYEKICVDVDYRSLGEVGRRTVFLHLHTAIWWYGNWRGQFANLFWEFWRHSVRAGSHGTIHEVLLIAPDLTKLAVGCGDVLEILIS